MSGPSYEEILHKMADGEARPEEIASLQEMLERDPDLRRRYDRILALTSTMREVGTVEPPPELRAEVLRAIRHRPHPAANHVSWLGSIRMGIQRRFMVRETMVFAGGVLVGALVLLGVRGDGNPLSREDLTGTMVSPSTSLERATIEEIPVRFGEAEGSLRTFSVAGGVQVEVDLQSPREILVVLGFDARSFAPVFVHQNRPSPHGVEIHPDRVMLRHVGENQVQIFLRGEPEAAEPLRVEFSAGEQWSEHTLATHVDRP